MSLLQVYLCNPRTRRVLSRKPGQAGFSLIELVVVIAVLAILAVVALPNFTGVTNSASAQAMKTGLSDIFKQCEVMRARQTPLAARLVEPPVISEVTFAPGQLQAQLVRMLFQRFQQSPADSLALYQAMQLDQATELNTAA